MIAILKKEISNFFSSLIGYIIIVVFLIITGLFLWVFPDSSVLDSGYASLDSLFAIAPWIFMFLIPAVTMRSFAEEKKQGTIELLVTRPITDTQLIFGKFLANFFLVIISLLPTLLYYFTIYQLGEVKGNIDSGAFIGSFIGLLLLGGAFVAIGVYASSITDNQIVAFTLSIFICFFCFQGFESISSLGIFGPVDNFIEQLGINAHYLSISKGVLDTRDAIYFISLVLLFVLLTKITLGSRKW
ncbi:MAG: ABC-2 type transport system permease protein [Sphingobacteriales bacterium]|jgi:ABC-2 type transport system permease protein